MAANPRRALGPMVMCLAIVLSACVSSAEAEEGSTDLLPMAAPTTVTTSATTTTSSIPTTTTTEASNDCAVKPVTDAFYQKQCTVLGIGVVGSSTVADAAIESAAEHVHGMLASRPDLAGALASAPIRVAVIGASERITELPDFADLYKLYPGTDWRRLGRSFPGTTEVPLAAGAEENLLCLEGDRFAGQNLFVRDFARTIRRFALAEVDEAAHRDIEQAFNRAIGEGLWQDTLAETNAEQYWAEVTQAYFDVNGYPAEDDDTSAIRTRDQLRRYDPYGYSTALSVYTDTAWRPPCH